jgi:hypothetical protein
MGRKDHQHDHHRHETKSGHTPKSLRTQRDQDQDNHSLSHCCGVCQDSPLGNYGQGLI